MASTRHHRIVECWERTVAADLLRQVVGGIQIRVVVNALTTMP